MAGALALKLLQEHGVKLSFVSGRSINLLREDARLLGADSYIAEAGCVVVRRHGKVVHANCGPFGLNKGITVFEEIAATGAPALLMEHFRPALVYHEPWHRDHDYSHLMRGHVSTAEADSFLAENGYPDLRLVDNGIIEDRGYNMPVSELHAYHLIPRQAGKGTAIQLDQELAELSREETVGCGDSTQDLEMAPFVRTLYLMSNALAGNPGIKKEITAYDNVVVVSGEMVEGFLEAVKRELDKN